MTFYFCKSIYAASSIYAYDCCKKYCPLSVLSLVQLSHNMAPESKCMAVFLSHVVTFNGIINTSLKLINTVDIVDLTLTLSFTYY